MQKVLLVIFSLVSLLFTVRADFVNAQNNSIREEAFGQLYSAAGDYGAGFGDYKDPRETVALIIRVALGLMGTIFFALTVYAGYLWMTARGEEENTSKAKKILTASIIGLAIILAAYSITNFVTYKLIRNTIGGSDDPLKHDFCLKNPNDDFCLLSD